MRTMSFSTLMALAGGLSIERPPAPTLSGMGDGGPVFRNQNYGVPKSRVKLNALIRVCPGGSHGIFASDIGEVRKPFDGETIEWTAQEWTPTKTDRYNANYFGLPLSRMEDHNRYMATAMGEWPDGLKRIVSEYGKRFGMSGDGIACAVANWLKAGEPSA